MIIDINCDMGEWSGGDMPAGETAVSGAMVCDAAMPIDAVLQTNDTLESDAAMPIDDLLQTNDTLESDAAMQSDAAIMPFISSANIACGAHAGDLVSMEHTIGLAKRHGVSVGAHPGFPDRAGFGRVNMQMPAHVLRASLHEQIVTIRNIAKAMGVHIRHVKPHGALYNMAAADPELARLIATLVADIDNNLIIFGLPGSELELAAKGKGLPFAAEVFADRAYCDDGSLLPRGMPGAQLKDVEVMTRRVVTMITSGYVLSVSGRKIMVKPDTVCAHGDNPVAPAFLKHLANKLKEAGIRVRCRH